MKANKQMSNLWNSGSTYAGRYENLFEYDANGNITTQIRKDAVGNAIDELTYQYAKEGGKLHHNRLYHLNDAVTNTAFDDDIDDMGTFDDSDLTAMMFNNNYVYDAIGNLIKDEQEEIDSMIWRPDGKLEAVIRDPMSARLNLKFDYDVSGNRVAKHVFDKNNDLLNSTYYVRDAQGNVMSVYKLDIDTVLSSLSYAQKERHIYGSSMLGMDTDTLEMIGASVADTTLFSYLVGNKRYQMSNHLGNVLAVISDKKLPIDANTDGDVNYYQPEVFSTSHYSPFGVELTCETALDPETDFDLIEEDVIYSAFKNTGLDSNGNLQTTDTVTGPWNHYGARGQQVVMQGEYIECEIGNEGITYNHNVFVGLVYNFSGYHPVSSIDYAWYFYHSGSNTMWKDGVNIGSASGGKFKAGDKFKIERKNDSIYYYKNNTLEITVVDDYPTTPLEIVTALLKENTKVYNLKVGKLHANNFCSKDSRYRYGFGGHEKIDEVKGKGNIVDMGDRWLDVRLGRTHKLDLHKSKYPAVSPYAFALNSPLLFNDPDGKDARVSVQKDPNGGGKIIIASTVFITGKGANAHNAKKYTEKAAEIYKPGVYTNDKGENFEIVFDVKFEYEPDRTKIQLQKQDGDNVLVYNKENVHSQVTSTYSFSKNKEGEVYNVRSFAGDEGVIGRQDNIGTSFKATIHEALHFLGLSDRYDDGNQPDEGFKNDIMGNPDGSEINQIHYDNIGRAFSDKDAGDYILKERVDINSSDGSLIGGSSDGQRPLKLENGK